MPVPKKVAEIGQMLQRGEEVSIIGVGKIKVIVKEARDGRNPGTGQTVRIPARRALKFTESRTMREVLNK